MPPKKNQPDAAEKSTEKKKTSSSLKSAEKKKTAKSGSPKSVEKTKTAKSGSPKSAEKAKTAKSSSSKSAKKPKEETGISCKTPRVMKLVEKSKGKNQVIEAGKSHVPSKLKGRLPLSKIAKNEGYDDVFDQGVVEIVNLTELAVKYEAPQVLDRFNACSCDRCVEIFSEIVLKKVPARFARITKSKLGIRSRELNGRVEPVKKIVQDVMIRELIGSKKRIFHDE